MTHNNSRDRAEEKQAGSLEVHLIVGVAQFLYSRLYSFRWYLHLQFPNPAYVEDNFRRENSKDADGGQNEDVSDSTPGSCKVHLIVGVAQFL